MKPRLKTLAAVGLSALLCMHGQAYGQTAPAAPAQPPSTSADSAGEKKKDSTKLDTVVIVDSDLTPVDVAAHDLLATPGATSLIRQEDTLKGRTSNLADTLRLQPGVLAQSNNGGEQTRLSIRGSGISRGPSMVPQGIQYLISGQTVKSATGYPITAPLEAWAMNYVEVYRGQSAFAEYGPLTVGGAINFVTKTGYDASPFAVRSEVGSDGYFKEQASSGLVSGPFDYYVSTSHLDYDGYRDHSRNSTTRAIANVGWQVTPDFSTRLNVEWSQEVQQNPGNLTLNQLTRNPQQSATPTYVPLRKDPEGVQVISNSTLRIDNDSTLSWGGLLQKTPNNNPGTPTNSSEFDQYAANGNAHYKRTDLLFGDLESHSTLTVINNNVLPSDVRYMNSAGVTTSKTYYSGNDAAVVLNEDLQVLPSFWITPGIAGLYSHRGAHADVMSTSGRINVNRDYFDFAPNLGLRYEFTPQSQVYLNAGRTVEAPYQGAFIQTTGVTSTPNNALYPKEQVSDTLELGTKGSEGIFQWDVALYRSWIEHELLTFLVAPGTTNTATATLNGNQTIHEGVEFGLGTILWHEDAPAKGKGARDRDPKSGPQPQEDKPSSLWAEQPDDHRAPHRLILQQAYTYNHFYFDNDPVYQSKSIAGIPVHVYQAELRYEHWSGFHVGPTVESTFVHYAGDFANTVFAPAYTIYGLRAGYTPPGQKWEIFFQADNLTDKTYVSVTSPIPNAKGIDSALYAPGAGRNVTGGFSFSF